MKWPASLVALVDYGIVDEVLRPLMSGKEAQVYLVRCGDEERVAKVYKEAEGRSFRQRADYTEGRRTRNSRDQRAVDKRTRHGKAQDEAAWRVAEVDRIRRLRDAGVRVPEPYEFVDGVLVMELVKDAEGEPAPRLGDLSFSSAEAGEIYDRLIAETVRMLAADIVHGDLSEFNVLMAADGPVIIDFPQAVDPTSNRNARTLLLRDVQNLHRFLSRFAPGRKVRRLGEEMWKLYEEGKLKSDTALRGTFKTASGPTDTAAVLALIEDAKQDAIRERRAHFDDDTELEGESEYAVSSSPRGKTSGGSDAKPAGPALRRVVDFTQGKSGKSNSSKKSKPSGRGSRSRSGPKGEDSGRDRPAAKSGGRRGGRGGGRSESSGRSRTASDKPSGSRSGDGRRRNAAGGNASAGSGQEERGPRSSQGSRGRRGGARGDDRGGNRRREGGQESRGSNTSANPRRGSRPQADERREPNGSSARSGDRPAEGGGTRRRSRRGRRPSGSGQRPNSAGQGNSTAGDRSGNHQQDAGARRHEGSRDREQERRPTSTDGTQNPRKRSRRRRRRPGGGGASQS